MDVILGGLFDVTPIATCIGMGMTVRSAADGLLGADDDHCQGKPDGNQ